MTASAPLEATTSQRANGATRAPPGTSNDLRQIHLAGEELIMKAITIFAALIVAVFLVSGMPTIPTSVSAQDGKKPPETVILGKESKLGQITFSHVNHVTKNRSVDGSYTDRLCSMSPHRATAGGSPKAQDPRTKRYGRPTEQPHLPQSCLRKIQTLRR